jgi:hypothetical protein
VYGQDVASSSDVDWTSQADSFIDLTPAIERLQEQAMTRLTARLTRLAAGQTGENQ